LVLKQMVELVVARSHDDETLTASGKSVTNRLQ
jgi:hypothetical protein